MHEAIAFNCPLCLFQLHFISSALSFYFVYDFCLYSNMSPLVSYFIRYLPFLVAVLLFPAVFMTRFNSTVDLLLISHQEY